MRKYANNTYLVRHDSYLAMVYHSTEVVKWLPNGDIVLYNGNWYTSTTKERISWALSGTQFGIFQKLGVWYIRKCIDGRIWNDANPTFKYDNGMILNVETDTVIGYGKDNPKADAKLKKQVKQYAQLCADSVPLPKPDGGDCWFCYMTTQNGESLGDATKNTDHLDSHIKEKYIVPSLVFRALKQYGNTDFILSLVFNNPDKQMLDIARERVKKSVYRYILQRKGYAI